MSVAAKIKSKQNPAKMLKRSLDANINTYADKTHFVYELLQNAEDAEARKVRFVLHKEFLELLHDGLPFTESNASAICDAANSDKPKDVNTKIGKFGVGFKAVFAICDTVKLFSEPLRRETADALPRFAFEIQDYTNPEDIDSEWSFDEPYTTRFIFPFNPERIGIYESISELHQDLTRKLTQLGAEVMLFLNHIESIEYVVVDGVDGIESAHGSYELERKDIGGGCTRITVLGENRDSNQGSTYLMYSKKDNGTRKNVNLVFAIHESGGKTKFIDASLKHKYISVYFPTEMESKLKFMIQAPFSTTSNRGSIQDRVENHELVSVATELLREVVADVKQKGKQESWLTLDFLNILPRDKQGDDWLLAPLYDASLDMFKRDEILPTIDGGFTSANNAYIARSKDLTEHFEGEKLCALVGNNNAKWMPTTLTEGNQELSALHRFLINEIKIKEIEPANLVTKLRSKASNANKTHPLWDVVDNEWLVKFYTWLVKEQPAMLREDKDRSLSTVPFIKATNDEFIAPYTCAYKYNIEKKTEDWSWNKNLYLFPQNMNRKVGEFKFVHEYIAEHCADFLDAMGIREPDSFNYFIEELNAGYCEEYEISQLKEALQFLREDKPEAVKEFKAKLQLRYINAKSKEKELATAGRVELYFANDNHGISHFDYFQDIVPEDGVVGILNEKFYTSNGIQQSDLLMLKKLGIKDSVVDFGKDDWPERKERNHLKCRNLGEFKRKLNFGHIDEVVKKININKEKTRIIWKLLKNVEKHLSGKWQFGQSKPDIRDDVSEIVKFLRDKAWLYNKDGDIVSPKEITRNELDTSLYGEVDKYSRLYDLLEFMEDSNEVNMEKIRDLVQSIRDLSPDAKQYLDEQLALLPEEHAEYDPTIDEDETKFPEDKILDEKQLTRTTIVAYNNADAVKYELRERSIRTSRGNYRGHVRQRYEGFCQMCHCPSRHWEVAEIFNKPKKELPQMNLSFCPNCASKYRIYRNDKNIMTKFKHNLASILIKDKETTPQVQLEGETIKFTHTHLAEIQTLLKEMERE